MAFRLREMWRRTRSHEAVACLACAWFGTRASKSARSPLHCAEAFQGPEPDVALGYFAAWNESWPWTFSGSHRDRRRFKHKSECPWIRRPKCVPGHQYHGREQPGIKGLLTCRVTLPSPRSHCQAASSVRPQPLTSFPPIEGMVTM